MNESFELLSSMSPKLKGRQKTVKKAITILALKKHFRRSSIYDKAPPVNNEDLAIIEASTGTSESSSNFERNDNNRVKNNVIIIDSTDSEDGEEAQISKSKKLSLKRLKSCDKNEADVDRIQEWLNNIEINKKKDDVTFFSQVSTIYGDEAPTGDGLAACSTFNDYLTRRFDELFVTDKKNPIKQPYDDRIADNSFSIEINTNLRSKLEEGKTIKSGISDCNGLTGVIKETKDPDGSKGIKAVVTNESLLTSDESVVKSLISLKSPALSSCWTPERPLNNGEYVTIRKKNDKIVHPKNSSPENSEEMETLLDSLYGAKWRKKQNYILPLSEPKKKLLAINKKKILVPNTERVLQRSNKENTQNKFNLNKLRTPITSPWVDRLKGLVDSDSSSNEDEEEKTKGIENVRARLDFCEASPSVKPTDAKRVDDKSKAKVDFDDSDVEESLEERIRKKTNNFKIHTRTNEYVDRKNGGIENNNKENNPDSSGKIKRKGPQKEILAAKSISDSNNTKINSKKTNKKTLKNNTDDKERSKSTKSSKACSEIEISSDEEYDKEVTRMCEVRRKSVMPLKQGRYSFLESLSGHVPLDKCDTMARIFRSSFKHCRDELKQKLFSLYNEKVFDNDIPNDTELEWNAKLRNTAGLCYCKKITHRDGQVVRKVKIALSSKVLDSPDRLRDTLIHEMCHAATWIVNQISNGHGTYWKNWALKAMRVFPELPPINRCHSYQIHTKYTYKCTGCGYSFGRHSKSLDIERKRCGHCHGKFELLLNKTNKSGETRSVPVTPRKQATAFSVFVKENYARYKEPLMKPGDVMKLLGQKFSELKVKK